MSFEFGLTPSLGLKTAQYYRRPNVSDTPVYLDDPLGELRVWPVRIFTFGRFEIFRANEPLRFSREVQRRALLLLKAILAFGGQQVSEARLVALMWPGAQGDVARLCLNRTVYRLRRLLGVRDSVVPQDNRISLDARYVWVDAWVVEQLLQRAEQYVTRESLDPLARCMATAVTLYRGPFLHEEQGVSWGQPYAHRLRRRLLGELFRIGRQLELNEREEDALHCYDQCLAIDPCAENVCRQLMSLYHRLGRLADALLVYRHCHNALIQQSGVSSSPQTQALLKELTAGET